MTANARIAVGKQKRKTRLGRKDTVSNSTLQLQMAYASAARQWETKFDRTNKNVRLIQRQLITR
jgi:hypothetical protein